MLDSAACWTMGDRCLWSVAVKTRMEDRAHPLRDCISLVFSVLGKSIGVEVGPSNLTHVFVLFLVSGAFSMVIIKSLSIDQHEATSSKQ